MLHIALDMQLFGMFIRIHMFLFSKKIPCNLNYDKTDFTFSARMCGISSLTFLLMHSIELHNLTPVVFTFYNNRFVIFILHAS